MPSYVPKHGLKGLIEFSPSQNSFDMVLRI